MVIQNKRGVGTVAISFDEALDCPNNGYKQHTHALLSCNIRMLAHECI